MTPIGSLHAFPKNRVKLYLHPESEPAKRMRMRTKNWMLLTFTWSSVLLLLFANLRGLGHFRSFRTNYGFLTSGKDRMLVFTPNSVKKYILWDAKCNAAKTEKAKWAQIWSLHDPTAETFCIKPRLDRQGSFVPWELTASKPWPGKLHTRQINLHEKCFISARANSEFVFDYLLVMGLFLLVKRKFKMQVLTLMVINGLKHDVRFVNPRTKHHYWTIRSVNKNPA